MESHENCTNQRAALIAARIGNIRRRRQIETFYTGRYVEIGVNKNEKFFYFPNFLFQSFQVNVQLNVGLLVITLCYIIIDPKCVTEFIIIIYQTDRGVFIMLYGVL